MSHNLFFPLHMYGAIIGISVTLGFWVASRIARKNEIRNSKFNITTNDVWGALWWMVVPAVIGARVYHLISAWEYYQNHLWQVFQIWNGGLGILGAIIGGFCGIWAYSKVIRVPLVVLADLAAFGMPIGQSLGRWGNFFNYELYGKPTNLPWGISIPIEYRNLYYQEYSRFHPLFFYESVMTLSIFIVLILVSWHYAFRLGSGFYFFLYLFFYGVVRFFLEFLRIENSLVLGFSLAKIVSILLILISLVNLIKMRKTDI